MVDGEGGKEREGSGGGLGVRDERRVRGDGGEVYEEEAAVIGLGDDLVVRVGWVYAGYLCEAGGV